MNATKKYYAVVIGHQPGIYEGWTIASPQVTGYPRSQYKGFSTYEEAQDYMEIEQSNSSSAAAATAVTATTATTTTVATTIDMLTQEQKNVINQLILGKNVALLGAAGCGKSFLLSVVYTEFPGLMKRYQQKSNGISKLPRIQICAMTGCAALLLGHKAKTLHSWAGIGLGKGTVSELYTKIRRNTKSMRQWLCTDLLIIDEVSMLTADLLDKLNELAKKIRSNKRPFGGMQVMLVGDFYQLPPVNKSDEPTKFAFESDAWKEIVGVITELTQIQRQKDEVFQAILKEARVGSLGKFSCQILQERQGLDWKEHKIRPTLIFPRRVEVDMINDSNLRALKGRRYNYKAKLMYDGKMPEGFTEQDEAFQRTLQAFDTNAAYASNLELALNAQVMLIANVQPEMGLVNGSRGVIVEFCPQTDLPIVEFMNGVKRQIGQHAWPIEDYEFISRSQIPLRLGYAATMHKVQGSTLDAALIDIGSGIFEYGQAYVALSRVRSLDALYVYDFDPTAFRVHPKVVEFYKNISIEPIEDVQLLQTEHIEEDVHPVITYPSKAIQIIHVNKCESINELESVQQMDNLEPGESAPISNWLYDTVPDEWKSCLLSCRPRLFDLSKFLAQKDFLPSKEHIWTALTLTPFSSVKVVILGQDPYPTPGNAHGLAFSVLPEVRPLPASLKNIYKELISDIGFIAPTHGNLESWSKQGVLLLNTVLSVEAGTPQSHSKMGWEEVTDQIIRSIAAQTEGTIFVLWGKSAQVKKKLLDLYLHQNKHRVFESAHPSPLSAHRGFFGSKPFSTINQWLTELGKEPIRWQIEP